MESLGTVLILAYTVWAIYSGYIILTGRSEWLDRRAPLNMLVKAFLSVIVGYFIAAFYLIYLILKLVGIFTRL